LLPSGILRDNAVNVLGTGMVIDLEHLVAEISRLREQGIIITPAHLKISDRATICMPYHRLLDNLEEDRLGDAKFGSTRRGIAPVYADKYMKKTFRMGDLLDMADIRRRLPGIVVWKNLTVCGGYHSPAVDSAAMLSWLEQYGSILRPYICDTTAYLTQAVAGKQNILFEAQLGALRDIDYGIIPYTSSSSTLAAYAPLGAGIPGVKLDAVLGIIKAYSSCVGEGPFTAELFGAAAEQLRAAGSEYGAATGRPRRVGGFDVVASRYGTLLQGANGLALTKLDVLSYLDQIPVCVAYRINGKETTVFPQGDALRRAEPVYHYLPGFKTDISACRQAADLPPAAMDYIRYIEKAVACPIRYVSVGEKREDYVILA
ncbi:MAG: adenylosuccinate synthetase, partial [Clostridiales bacterium]